MEEGGNEAIYFIGYEDNGFPRGLSDDDLDASIQTVASMAHSIHCQVQIFRVAASMPLLFVEGEEDDTDIDYKGVTLKVQQKKVAQLIVRKIPRDEMPKSLRIAVM